MGRMLNFYKKRKFKTEHSDYYNLIRCEESDWYGDVGCADGSGINIVKRNNNLKKTNCFGVDTYHSMNNVIELDMNVDNLYLKNIDVISSFEVIEHINNTKHFISEIRKSLKKNGMLYISTPNLAWWANRLLLLFGFQPANTEVDFNHSMYGKPKIMKDNMGSGHIHVFTHKAMKEFLKDNGFKIIKCYPSASNYGGVLKLFSLIDKLISRVPSMARGYVYKCIKEVKTNEL